MPGVKLSAYRITSESVYLAELLVRYELRRRGFASDPLEQEYMRDLDGTVVDVRRMAETIQSGLWQRNFKTCSTFYEADARSKRGCGTAL